MIPTLSMVRTSRFKVDHFAHHENADAHPAGAARQHQIAHLFGEEQAEM